ncbi:hypothetical protein LZ554_005395 [Drepanopeziza brunnea f. sp. 'monogermtubi']|nr:hypothetical protein LZ554_005395 [Drepanopeziza brunnea f. sp. 'monogermtubi']
MMSGVFITGNQSITSCLSLLLFFQLLQVDERNEDDWPISHPVSGPAYAEHSLNLIDRLQVELWLHVPVIRNLDK